MPTVKPKKDESKDSFIKRFMASATAKKEYPDEDQRLAVAYEQWKEAYANSEAFVQITQNMSQLVKYDTLDGKEYLVAPVILMREGVLNGSAGAILYKTEDMASSVPSWNHKPVVVYHPVLNNQPLSAASKTVIEKQQIGLLLDAHVVNDALKANAWIDIDKANKVDPRIIEMLENNQIIEVSTGLYTNDIVMNGEYNGKEYTRIARNYRPDHLALLPDQIGACSVADGAGLPRINKQNEDKQDKQGETVMDRMEQINKLIANEANGWVQGDVEFLNSIDLDKFDKLFAMNQEAPVEPKVADVKVDVTPVENKETVKPKEDAKVLVDNAEEPVTLDSYIAKAPEGFKQVLKEGVVLYNNARSELINTLKANAKCGFTKEQLEAKSTDELGILKNMLPEQVAPVVNYEGQAGTFHKAPEVKVEPLIYNNYL